MYPSIIEWNVTQVFYVMHLFLYCIYIYLYKYNIKSIVNNTYDFFILKFIIYTYMYVNKTYIN